MEPVDISSHFLKLKCYSKEPHKSSSIMSYPMENPPNGKIPCPTAELCSSDSFAAHGTPSVVAHRKSQCHPLKGWTSSNQPGRVVIIQIICVPFALTSFHKELCELVEGLCSVVVDDDDVVGPVVALHLPASQWKLHFPDDLRRDVVEMSHPNGQEK